MVRLLFITVILCVPVVGRRAFAVEYKFLRVMDQKTAVPGLPGNFFHTTRGGEIRGDRVLLSGGFASDNGYFIAKGGSLETVVSTGHPFPGHTFGSYFGGASLTASGAAFSYNHPGTGGVFHSTASGIARIIRDGDIRPEGVLNRFGPPAADGDDIAFRAEAEASWGGTVGGVYLKTDTGLTRVADSQSFHFNQPISVENGTVAFVDLVMNGSGGDGIFLSDGSSTRMVVQGSVAYPQLRQGKLQYFASKRFDGSGVYLWDEGSIVSVISTNDPAPVGKFTGFFQSAFNGDATALRAIYDGGAGIFSTHGGTLHSVIQDGDELFGGTVGSVYTGPGGLGEDGRVAFTYFTETGEEGVAIAVPVPEPSVVALVVSCLPLSPRLRRPQVRERDRR